MSNQHQLGFIGNGFLNVVVVKGADTSTLLEAGRQEVCISVKYDNLI